MIGVSKQTSIFCLLLLLSNMHYIFLSGLKITELTESIFVQRLSKKVTHTKEEEIPTLFQPGNKCKDLKAVFQVNV